MYNEFEDEIWESFLKAAVIENSLNEIKDYPSEQEINGISLPVHYDLRMRKVIKRYRFRKNIKISLRYGRKIASIILLILGISFTAMLFSEDVRAACRNVIVNIYEKYIQFDYVSSNSETVEDLELHIAKLNGRLCGTKRPHSVSEQPNFYQSLQSNPYNDSSHPSGGE